MIYFETIKAIIMLKITEMPPDIRIIILTEFRNLVADAGITIDKPLPIIILTKKYLTKESIRIMETITETRLTIM
jgi:hypothetical protein